MITQLLQSIKHQLLQLCSHIAVTGSVMLEYYRAFAKRLFFSRKKSPNAPMDACADAKSRHTSICWPTTDCWVDRYVAASDALSASVTFNSWPDSVFPRKKISLPRRKKTLVIDLDETLVHATNKASSLATRRCDFTVELIVGDQVFHYFVFKRPHVEYFLKKVAAWFNVAIFTASIAEYADPVIEWLTSGSGGGAVRAAIVKRLFRSSCVAKDGLYLKNLALVEPDLSQVFLIDNSVAAFAVNNDNGILIKTWIDDFADEALLDLLPFLDALRFVEDVRSILSLRRIKSAML